jgi:hypothetical protein
MKLLFLLGFFFRNAFALNGTAIANKAEWNVLNTTDYLPLTSTCSAVHLSHLDESHWCSNMIPSLIKHHGHVPPATSCLATLDEVRPTQGGVGEVLVQCKRHMLENRYLSGEHWFSNYMNLNPAPAFIGASWGKKWAMYITDHHHLARALKEAFGPRSHHAYLDDEFEPHRMIKICVLNDYHQYSQQKFWAKMFEHGNVWPRDRFGEPLAHFSTELPLHVADLGDDPYRSLSEYVRDAHGYIKCGVVGTEVFPKCQKTETDSAEEESTPMNVPFEEFFWADFMRDRKVLSKDNGLRSRDPFLLYNMTWRDQVTLFNRRFQRAVVSVTSPIAKEFRPPLPGLNLERQHVEVMKINDSTGCDFLYGQLFIPKKITGATYHEHNDSIKVIPKDNETEFELFYEGTEDNETNADLSLNQNESQSSSALTAFWIIACLLVVMLGLWKRKMISRWLFYRTRGYEDIDGVNRDRTTSVPLGRSTRSEKRLQHPHEAQKIVDERIF